MLKTVGERSKTYRWSAKAGSRKPRPVWLGRQHLDIFIPALSVAIEFQGLQHDQPVAFFGGLAAFEQTRVLDARKQQLCRRHGVRLLYVRENYQLPDVLSQITNGMKLSAGAGT
jgi:hypothetical protein